MTKRTLITCFAIALCVLSGTAFAFGGGGGGRTAKNYERHGGKGVTSLGIHMHSNGQQGEFCLYDLSNDPNAEEIQPGVFHCKGGTTLDCSTGVCTACPAGTYAGAEDESCSTTPAGSYTPSGASEPIPCPVGTYSANEGATECTPAEPGYYTHTTGATDVIECEASYYCPGGTDHQLAEPGYYVPTSGAADQTAADPGYYVDTSGATAQTMCPAGTYTSATASTSCQETDPGYEPAVPTPDAEVPCTDTTTMGACGCPSDKYADGQGNCYAGECANVWINECTPSCTQATGPQKLADGTDCQDSLGTCQNGVCCGPVEGSCVTQQQPELYCVSTIQFGYCGAFGICQTGKSTRNWIMGVPHASGACAGEGQEIYCVETNDNGQCRVWDYCVGNSSKDWIVGIPNAHGACGDVNEIGEEEVYCSYTNEDGQCAYWSTCEEGYSTKDWIVGTPNATGACADYYGYELYCEHTNDDGQCAYWDICEQNRSTRDWIVGTANAYGDCCYEDQVPQHDGTCATGYCKTADSDGNCTEYAACPSGIYHDADAYAAGVCAEEGQEIYCTQTNGNGQCYSWNTCQEGKSSQDWVIDVPNAYGGCAEEGQEVFCAETNDSGQCLFWNPCLEGTTTQDWIVDIPNAYGACGNDGYPEVYCRETNAAGQCTYWYICQEGRSTRDWIVGTPNATGACCEGDDQMPTESGQCGTKYCATWGTDSCAEYAACPSGNYKDATATSNGVCAEEGQEIYCTQTNGNGQCTYWGACSEGYSTTDRIIGVPNAKGACGNLIDSEFYCRSTNESGQCTEWGTCQPDMSSADKIIDVPNATGACAFERYTEVYCDQTNAYGECTLWKLCHEGWSTSDRIVHVPDAQGACGTSAYHEVYCDQTNDDGQCTQWKTCSEGKSTRDWIVETPNATGACCEGDDQMPTESGQCGTKYCATWGTDSCAEYAACPSGIYQDADANATTGVCAEEGYELYCTETNADGQCYFWNTCQEGMSSRDWIVNVPDAYGTCAGGEYPELYCSQTNSNGQCHHWDSCQEGRSTLDSIINTPNAYGTCAYDEGYEVYCYETNGDGQCTSWNTCEEGKSSTNKIVGIDEAYGACAAEDQEVYCYRTNAYGQCYYWKTCQEGYSSKNLIVGVPDASGTCGYDEYSEIYCAHTNDDYQCESWDTCQQGRSTRDWIVNKLGSAHGVCAGEDGEVYCVFTSDDASCWTWGSCLEGHSTKDWFVDKLGTTHGVCAEEGEEVYCTETSSSSAGDCIGWGTCPEGKSTRDWIVGTANATGHCCNEEGQVPQQDGSCATGYCKTWSNGSCAEYAACPSGNYRNADANATTGICAANASDRIYCPTTDKYGTCLSYATCPSGRAMGNPEGVATNMYHDQGGMGVCCASGQQTYCYQRAIASENSSNAGECVAYGCYNPQTERTYCSGSESSAFAHNGLCWSEFSTSIGDICCEAGSPGEEGFSVCSEYKSSDCTGTLTCAPGYEKYCHEKEGNTCVSYGCCTGASCPAPEPSCNEGRQCGNTCCGETEFCSRDNSTDTGTCMPLGDSSSISYADKNLLGSHQTMSWYAAMNWCAAQDKTLVTLASTGIDKNSLGSYFDENGFCGGSYECGNIDWVRQRNYFPYAYDQQGYWWTQDECTVGQCLNSSYGYKYLVRVYHQYIDWSETNNTSNYALCE